MHASRLHTPTRSNISASFAPFSLTPSVLIFPFVQSACLSCSLSLSFTLNLRRCQQREMQSQLTSTRPHMGSMISHCTCLTRKKRGNKISIWTWQFYACPALITLCAHSGVISRHHTPTSSPCLIHLNYGDIGCQMMNWLQKAVFWPTVLIRKQRWDVCCRKQVFLLRTSSSDQSL